MKLFYTIKKVISFTVTDALLAQTENGAKLKTPKVDVTDKLQCCVHWFPNGKKDRAGYVSVFLWASSIVKADYTLTLVGSSVTKNYSYLFSTNHRYGSPMFASHQEIQDAFQDGSATITCDVEFEIELPGPVCCSSRFTHKLYESCDDIPHDCELLVDGKSIQAHKHLLAVVSPTLYAYFIHNMGESATSTFVITDFDYETVKASIDFLYGRPMDCMSLTIIVTMLRFCDKYNIKSKHLETIIFDNITVETFGIIVEYSYDCSKKDLFDECAKFFVSQIDVIKQQHSFKSLHGYLAVQILQQAFSVTSVFKTLRQAHKHGISAANDYLESELIISFDNFCKAAKYAWECDRAVVQSKCANFLKPLENRGRIVVTTEFIKLGDLVPKIFLLVQDLINS